MVFGVEFLVFIVNPFPWMDLPLDGLGFEGAARAVPLSLRGADCCRLIDPGLSRPVARIPRDLLCFALAGWLAPSVSGSG